MNYIQFVTIGSAALGSLLNILPAQAVSFNDVTQGNLTFRATAFSSSIPDGVPITGQGTFNYQAEPIEGVFAVLVTESGLDYQFFDDPNDVPTSVISSVEFTPSDNFRLVTNVDISLETEFSYINNNNNSFFGALLFQPPESSSFPNGSGGLFIISPIAPRFPPDTVSLEEGWFLGDPFGFQIGQLSLTNDGRFRGSVLDLPVPINFDGGIWRAEAVSSPQPPAAPIPESQPFSWLVASTTLGLAALSKRRLLKKYDNPNR